MKYPDQYFRDSKPMNEVKTLENGGGDTRGYTKTMKH